MKRTFIIAEIGINHNGDLSIAKELIDVASQSGCDAVKFQKRDINVVYTKNTNSPILILILVLQKQSKILVIL